MPPDDNKAKKERERTEKKLAASSIKRKRSFSYDSEPIDDQVKKVKVEESPFSNEYLSQLVDLQQKIANLNDKKELQRIVDVVESSGSYQMSSTTFDFDLCTLDVQTIRRIQQCLSTWHSLYFIVIYSPILVHIFLCLHWNSCVANKLNWKFIPFSVEKFWFLSKLSKSVTFPS